MSELAGCPSKTAWPGLQTPSGALRLLPRARGPRGCRPSFTMLARLSVNASIVQERRPDQGDQ